MDSSWRYELPKNYKAIIEQLKLPYASGVPTNNDEDFAEPTRVVDLFSNSELRNPFAEIRKVTLSHVGKNVPHKKDTGSKNDQIQLKIGDEITLPPNQISMIHRYSLPVNKKDPGKEKVSMPIKNVESSLVPITDELKQNSKYKAEHLIEDVESQKSSTDIIKTTFDQQILEFQNRRNCLNIPLSHKGYDELVQLLREMSKFVDPCSNTLTPQQAEQMDDLILEAENLYEESDPEFSTNDKLENLYQQLISIKEPLSDKKIDQAINLYEKMESMIYLDSLPIKQQEQLKNLIGELRPLIINYDKLEKTKKIKQLPPPEIVNQDKMGKNEKSSPLPQFGWNGLDLPFKNAASKRKRDPELQNQKKMNSSAPAKEHYIVIKSELKRKLEGLDISESNSPKNLKEIQQLVDSFKNKLQDLKQQPLTLELENLLTHLICDISSTISRFSKYDEEMRRLEEVMAEAEHYWDIIHAPLQFAEGNLENKMKSFEVTAPSVGKTELNAENNEMVSPFVTKQIQKKIEEFNEMFASYQDHTEYDKSILQSLYYQMAALLTHTQTEPREYESLENLMLEVRIFYEHIFGAGI